MRLDVSDATVGVVDVARRDATDAGNVSARRRHSLLGSPAPPPVLKGTFYIYMRTIITPRYDEGSFIFKKLISCHLLHARSVSVAAEAHPER